MSFGLCNAVQQTFQRFIDQVLSELPFCYEYTDNVLIASATPEEHKKARSSKFALGWVYDHAILLHYHKPNQV